MIALAVVGATMSTASTKNASWANKAIDNELSIIADMPQGNINKPAHPFFVSMLKIASIVKGGYVPQYEALNGIKKTCAPLTWIPQKEIDYQWQRAYDKAQPRHPKEQNSLPEEREEKTAVPERLYEYDLAEGRFIFLREVSAAVVGKAEQLADALNDLLETGELPDIPNLIIRNTETDPNGVSLSLQFPRYSQALADCVFIACSRLKGFIWRDFKTGVFTIWLRTRPLMTHCDTAE